MRAAAQAANNEEDKAGGTNKVVGRKNNVSFFHCRIPGTSHAYHVKSTLNFWGGNHKIPFQSVFRSCKLRVGVVLTTLGLFLSTMKGRYSFVFRYKIRKLNGIEQHRH